MLHLATLIPILTIDSVFHPVKNILKIRQLKVEPIDDYVVLWFPSPSHFLRCAVFYLKGSHYAPQCAQIAFQDAFYKLQIAFSLLPTAEIVPEFCHVHSENNIKTKI